MFFIPFTCLITAARTCSTMLTKSDEGVAGTEGWTEGRPDIRLSGVVRPEVRGIGMAGRIWT